ncbi:TPA: hypothetical protein ACIAHZ_004048 [Enterobacter roggenkampii]|uniref:hypothetical protein n=1 Tax=Enterobacter roggenkampii TaxID=1812935 RepID=UPI00378591D4
MSERKGSPDKYATYLNAMLGGKTLLPDEQHDRQALARIADGIRSVCFVPVETVRMEDNVVGYRITRVDAREYIDNRAEQMARQRRIIEHAENQRDARRAKKLFARLNLELPPEVAALAREDKDAGSLDAEVVPLAAVDVKKVG